MTRLVAAFVALAALAGAGPACAHEIRPALLDLKEQSPGWFEMTWKVPMRGDRVLHLEPVLPEVLTVFGPVSEEAVPGALVKRATYKSDGRPIVGESIFIEGLSALQIDVLIRIELLDDRTYTAIVRPGSPSFQIPARATRGEVTVSYWRMGVLHILEGIDHLLFLAALTLIVGGLWRLLKTVTAFTVAHSITLALATLGLVHVPSAPTEAIISLSIVFLAVEIVHERAGHPGLTTRYPWIVAFGFGLFHGLGFAGALSQIGLPEHEVPMALLMFNVGVETGQVLFLVAVMTVLGFLRRFRVAQSALTWQLATYAIGGVAAYWTIERVVSFLATPL